MNTQVNIADTIRTLATLVRLHEGNRDSGVNALLVRAEWCACASSDLVEEMKRIQRRSFAHPEDTDEDRKRNLYHVESIAKRAIARIQGESP